MSHVARITCQFKNLDDLAEACRHKNAELALGQKTFKAWSRGTYEHAVRLLDAKAGTYEAGVVRNGDSWDLQADLDMPQSRPLVERFGYGFEYLKNEYLAVVAEKQLRSEGWMVERVDEGERIELRAFA